MSNRPLLHLTVAAVLFYQGRYLLVEEHDKRTGQRVLNQPAGHVEHDESLEQAMQRELHEETGLLLKPQSWLGISQLVLPTGDRYFRVNFVFEPAKLPDDYQPQDADILALHWLTAEELSQHPLPLRSPLVREAIQQHQQQLHLPLAQISGPVMLCDSTAESKNM